MTNFNFADKILPEQPKCMGARTNSFTRVIIRLRQALSRHNLLPPTNRLLIAVSGGQDSLALAESLNHLHKQKRWRHLSLAHCDHGWPHDKGIADHVQQYATHKGLQLHVINAGRNAIGLSENAAREWRYGQMAQLAQKAGYDAVVTAHTRTDLAETVLFNLAHGAGADGLAALTWKRQLCKDVYLVRPLLDVSRDDTKAFCKERGLDVWNDHYNEDSRYARNRIRLRVMPVLKECINKQVEEALARTAHLLRDEAQYLHQKANETYKNVLLTQKDTENNLTDDMLLQSNSGKDSVARSDQQYRCSENKTNSHAVIDGKIIIAINRKLLAEECVAIQRRVIRNILQNYVGLSHFGSNFAQVEALRSLFHGEITTTTASLCGNTCATVEGDSVVIFRQDVRTKLSGQDLSGQPRLGLKAKASMIESAVADGSKYSIQT